LREALTMYQAMGVRLYRPHLLAYVAEGLLALGEVREGLAAVDEGLSLTRGNLDRYYEPELWRLKGELLLAAGKAGKSGRGERQAAKFCFEQGLKCAVRQESKSLELRCALSYARLFPALKEGDEAYHRLNEIYRWFNEGFDTQDLKDARAFLKELWKTRADSSQVVRL
jgi:predicted ATPase